MWKTYLNVTDGRTDGRTTYCGITVRCVASRGKNCFICRLRCLYKGMQWREFEWVLMSTIMFCSAAVCDCKATENVSTNCNRTDSLRCADRLTGQEIDHRGTQAVCQWQCLDRAEFEGHARCGRVFRQNFLPGQFFLSQHLGLPPSRTVFQVPTQ